MSEACTAHSWHAITVIFVPLPCRGEVVVGPAEGTHTHTLGLRQCGDAVVRWRVNIARINKIVRVTDRNRITALSLTKGDKRF